MPPAWAIWHRSPKSVSPPDWPDPLDDGETKAIQLARELSADLLLMEEAAGRAVARRLDLTVTGVVGLLLEAKRRGHLPRLKPALDQLREGGFWLSEPIYREVLRIAEVSPVDS